MTPEEWREQIGRHIENRRTLLHLSKRAAAKAAGISEIVWRQLESGKRQLAPGHYITPNPETSTKVGVCRALHWRPDSVDRMLGGRLPEDSVEVEVELLRDESYEHQVALEELADELKGRISQVATDWGDMYVKLEARVDKMGERLSQLDGLAGAVERLERSLKGLSAVAAPKGGKKKPPGEADPGAAAL